MLKNCYKKAFAKDPDTQRLKRKIYKNIFVEIIAKKGAFDNAKRGDSRMFLDEKVVKKLMKEAYKTVGLRLGKSEDSMYIGGSYWEIEAKQKFLHKNVIAAIYELVGFLPEDGEWFVQKE